MEPDQLPGSRLTGFYQLPGSENRNRPIPSGVSAAQKRREVEAHKSTFEFGGQNFELWRDIEPYRSNWMA